MTTARPDVPPASPRLLGVDLVRGLAAYGVVVIHTLGEVPRSASGGRFVGAWLGFVVPYFLAAALFLTTGRLLKKGPAGFARGRFERLVVPYLAWTLVFVAVRAALYLASGRYGALRRMLAAPLSLVVLGKASAQLYFIPLLLVGEALAVGLVRACGDRPRLVAALALLGLAASPFATLRDAPVLRDPAVPDAVRVGLTLASYVLWSLPFVGLALWFQTTPVRRSIEGMSLPAALGVAAVAVGLDVVGSTGRIESVVPFTTWEVVVAFTALAVAIGVSPRLRPSRPLASLSACTFGIYLVHPLVAEALERLIRRLGLWSAPEGDAGAIALVAAATFAVSWAVVAATIRLPVVARVLYGERS